MISTQVARSRSNRCVDTFHLRGNPQAVDLRFRSSEGEGKGLGLPHLAVILLSFCISLLTIHLEWTEKLAWIKAWWRVLRFEGSGRDVRWGPVAAKLERGPICFGVLDDEVDVEVW